jgi:hypothetical protein
MKAPEQLPIELVWTEEGHLSEIAMTAIADGEEVILPRDAFGHLGLCEVCAAGVDGAAALSIAVSRAFSNSAPAVATEAVEVPIPFPQRAAALAVVVGALATLPNLAAIYAWIGRMWWALREGTPIVTRQAITLLPRAWSWLPIMSLTAAMLLLLVGLSVARLAPRVIER